MTAPLARAIALHRAGQYAAALTAYQDLLATEPDNADALHLTGVLAHQMGRTSTGIAFIERAIALNPAAAMFHRNMAELRTAAGDHAKAAEHLARAITLNPRDAAAHAALGTARAACGDPQGAVFAYRAALAIDPTLVPALNNLGLALQDIDDPDGACAAWHSAIAIDPHFAPALNNLGTALWSDERLDAAIEVLQRAVAADPNNAEAAVNLGQLLLNRGDLSEGWRLLEARRQVRHGFAAPHGIREWTGPGDPCGRLLVCAEQGLGDELMFASCLSDLQAAQPRTTLVVECDPRLGALFARSLPGCEIRPYQLTADRRRANRRDWLTHTAIDAFVPAGTLPLWFRSSPADFPREAGYLTADPGRVAHWRNWLDGITDGGRARSVGLCWRSGIGGGHRDSLVVPLADWAPLLTDPAFAVVNLQYGAGGPALVSHADALGTPVHQPPGLDLMDALDDVAALVAALDTVVSAATSVCEIAGALGRPTVRVVRGVDWSMLGQQGRRPWHPNTTTHAASRHTPASELVQKVLTTISSDFFEIVEQPTNPKHGKS
ncbi:MAG: tetratricopeptide repeat protein [Alphaproteobacteria bacterium]